MAPQNPGFVLPNEQNKSTRVDKPTKGEAGLVPCVQDSHVFCDPVGQWSTGAVPITNEKGFGWKTYMATQHLLGSSRVLKHPPTRK